MLSREDVIYGYRFVLGREPESDAVISEHQRSPSIAELRSTLIGSPEFKTQAPEFLGTLTLPGFENKELAIFDEFASPYVKPTPGFITDFHGSRTRTSSLWDGVDHLDGKVQSKPIAGDYHGDVVEWLGLFKSVKAAGGQFVAMELGAGFGPWLIAGAVAALRLGVTDIRLLGVEADPGRFAHLPQHFCDNGFDPKDHELLLAGVGPVSGKMKMTRLNGAIDSGDFEGEMIDVDILSLSGLIEKQPLWDLVHVDIQGTEVEVCASCLDLIKQRVRYLIVGTHSRKLDAEMMELMFSGGFVLENERPCQFNFDRAQPSLRRMTFCDGSQVWRNPDL